MFHKIVVDYHPVKVFSTSPMESLDSWVGDTWWCTRHPSSSLIKLRNCQCRSSNLTSHPKKKEHCSYTKDSSCQPAANHLGDVKDRNLGLGILAVHESNLNHPTPTFHTTPRELFIDDCIYWNHGQHSNHLHSQWFFPRSHHRCLQHVPRGTRQVTPVFRMQDSRLPAGVKSSSTKGYNRIMETIIAISAVAFTFACNVFNMIWCPKV